MKSKLTLELPARSVLQIESNEQAQQRQPQLTTDNWQLFKMGSTQHPDFEENFLLKPSKVDDLFKFLDEIAKANKME